MLISLKVNCTVFLFAWKTWGISDPVALTLTKLKCFFVTGHRSRLHEKRLAFLCSWQLLAVKVALNIVLCLLGSYTCDEDNLWDFNNRSGRWTCTNTFFTVQRTVHIPGWDWQWNTKGTCWHSHWTSQLWCVSDHFVIALFLVSFFKPDIYGQSLFSPIEYIWSKTPLWVDKIARGGNRLVKLRGTRLPNLCSTSTTNQ